MPFIPDKVQGGFVADKKSVAERRTEAQLAEKEAQTPLAQRFLGEVPGQIAKQLFQEPARFVASAAVAPVDIARQSFGLAQNKAVEPLNVNVPFVGKTFQRKASEQQKEIIEGKRPLIEGLAPFAEVPLAGVQTASYANIAKSGASAAKSMFQRRAEERASDFALKLTAPKVTPTVAEAAFREGRTTAPGILRSSKILPTNKDQLVAESVKDVVKKNAKITENIDAIRMKVSQINNGVSNMIADRKIPFNTNQLRSKLNEGNEELRLIFASDQSAKRTYDAVVNEFMRHVGSKDTSGLFKARQTFDRVPAIKKYLETEALGENTRREIVLAVRRAANEFVAKQLPVNNPYRNLLSQESYMLEALGNVAETNAKTLGKNTLQLLTEQYPVLKWLVGGLGVGLLGGAGVGVGSAIIGSTDR